MSPKSKKSTRYPKYVYEVNGRVVFRPRVPIHKRSRSVTTDKNGFYKPPIRLGRVGDPDDKILRKYLLAKQVVENECTGEENTLYWLNEKYVNSFRFQHLQPNTQKDYEGLLNRILGHNLRINGRKAKLGDLKAARLTKPLLRKVLDNRLQQYQKEGKSGVSTVNRQFAALSALLAYAIQYHEGVGLENNPCNGIERHKENRRDRYVTDEEYNLQLEASRELAPPYLAVVFEHAYLLASRSIEVTDLKIKDVLEEGYLVNRRKGSKNNIILWSDRLRSAYADAVALHNEKNCTSEYLIPSTVGNKLTKNTLQSAMRNLKKKMIVHYEGHSFWNLHDLKRKGISDAKDKNIGGHRSHQIRENYNVSLETFSPPK